MHRLIRTFSLTILLFNFYHHPCFASGPDTLRGNVRHLNVYLLKEKRIGDNVLVDSLLISSKQFDKSKNILEDILYADDGGMMIKVKCAYNSRGDKTETAVFDGTNKLHNKTTYKYNSSGKLIEEAIYEKDNEIESKTIYSYDKAGNKVSEAKTREGGELLKSKSFNYDERGNVIEEKEFDNKGVLELKLSYKYDNRNNKIEEIRYDGNRQETRTVFSYTDDNKKKSEEHYYGFEKSNSRTEWQFDNEQHLIAETIFDYQNKVMQKSSFTFVNGKLTEEEKDNSRREYKYDSLGNEIKERIFSRNKLISEKEFDTKGNVLLWQHYSSGILSYSESYGYDSTKTKLLRITKHDKQNVLIEDSYCTYDSNGNIIEERNKGADGKTLVDKLYVYSYY